LGSAWSGNRRGDTNEVETLSENHHERSSSYGRFIPIVKQRGGFTGPALVGFAPDKPSREILFPASGPPEKEVVL